MKGVVESIAVVLSKEVVRSMAEALIRMTEQIKAKPATTALGGCSRLLGCQMSTSLFSARGGAGTVAGWRGHTTVGLRYRDAIARLRGERRVRNSREFGVQSDIFRTPQLTGCKKRGRKQGKAKARHGDGGPVGAGDGGAVGAFRSNGVVLQHARSSWRRPTRSCCQSPWKQRNQV